MRTHSFKSLAPHGFHRVAYAEWGDPESSDIALCVHGLTRNGRDFDHLAAALQGERRVLCPDVAGRGRSEWLAAVEDYGYPTYCADMAALLARVGGEAVDWVGTSMGGLIGMMLAAQPGTPIRRLVMNDVGPFVPKEALERIAAYVGTDPHFASLGELERHLREIHAPFGPLTDEQWAHLAHCSVRELPDGAYALAYDPGIATAFKTRPLEDLDLWALWDNVRCPVLVLRGAESDLLLPDTARQMRERGPHAEVVELAGIGHAPALMEHSQIDTVRDWLLAD